MNSYILETFTEQNIPNLDVAVMGALELFQDTDLPTIDTSAYKKPLIVGSGNAAATGKILFANTDAVYGTESSAEGILTSLSTIDAVIIISASGSKHAPILVELAHKHNKTAVLITNTPDSAAGRALKLNEQDKEYVLPKNREPYTYNTSTYMGMILSKYNEDPAQITAFIHDQIDNIEWPDFSMYQKYYLLVPTEFEGIIRLLNIKFIELFGREIARDIETIEYVKHATTVVPSENELFIALGVENDTWGEPSNRLHVPLMQDGGYAAAMAVSYYVVGQIQSHYAHLFKDNIAGYTEFISDVFGSTIKPIVD